MLRVSGRAPVRANVDMSDPQPETRPLSGRLLEQTERRTHSIYGRSDAPGDLRAMGEIFSNSELPLSLRFSAVLAAFAYFKFPLQLSAFRSLIPRSAWNEHFRFRYTSMKFGVWPIFCGEGEWAYELRIGPQIQYDLHIVYIASNSSSIFDRGMDAEFEPPPDSSVVRYTLCHPFLQPELHDPSGIYLFNSA